MNTSKILNLVLAIAVLTLVIELAFAQGNKNQTSKSNSPLENIYSRASIRSYQNKAVEEEKVEQLLKAAMSAPTAANKQPWAFIVIDDKDVLKKLADNLPHAKMTAEAPLAIAVCGDLSKALDGDAADYWVQDASAASENLLLAAHALGLGAVWTGVYPIKDRVAAVSKILNLPENIIPLNVIPIGYPEGNTKPKDKWNQSNIHKNKW